MFFFFCFFFGFRFVQWCEAVITHPFFICFVICMGYVHVLSSLISVCYCSDDECLCYLEAVWQLDTNLLSLPIIFKCFFFWKKKKKPVFFLFCRDDEVCLCC